MDIFAQTTTRPYHKNMGPTSSFKAVSRDKKPTWGNRVVRDHNDLVYDANPESIAQRLKKSAKQKKIVSNNEEDSSPIRKYEYSPFKQRQLPKTSQSTRNLNQGLSPFRYLKDVQEYQSKTRAGLSNAPGSSRKNRGENVQVTPFNQYGLEHQQQIAGEQYYNQRKSQPNLMGLSQFQYENTIGGKISRRTNHHIDFQKNKTHKIDNTNRVWYDFSKDIQKSESVLQKEKQKELGKLHSFKSYSAHRLFFRSKRMEEGNGCGNGGLLDKFYDTANPRAYELTHERVAKDVVNYKKMTAHPALFKKLGTDLEYDTQTVNTLSVGNKKRPSFEVSQTQRQLVFTRQVISPRRGCFR